MASDILIVDDETDIRELISGILEDEGHETRLAKDSSEALAAIEDRRPALIILDIWLQGSDLDGLELLDRIKKSHPDLAIVIISGHGNIETAVAAIKRGAYDYIEKPFNADRLVLVTTRALEASMLKRENLELRERTSLSSEMIGKSTAMKQLRVAIKKVAPTNSRVLINGPYGSGKELAARVLHDSSPHKQTPFVVLNAAAMAPDRVEIELFGIEEGSSGHHKVGALEQAHGGTLFIAEIADMPMETQGKVLRALVEQSFQRVGGGPMVHVEVRIVSSTSRNLEREIVQNRFREDLYHRIGVVPIKVPALADRREDIPALVKYFIKQLSLASGLKPRQVSDDAMAILQSHDWPGNVRQLRNNVERLLILCDGDSKSPITVDLLPDEIAKPVPISQFTNPNEKLMSLPLREARVLFEREYLVTQINRFGGNISRTSEFVGMERSALHRKLRSLGVPSSERKASKRKRLKLT